MKSNNQNNPFSEVSLRDQFAMAALTGFTSARTMDLARDSVLNEIVEDCYAIADAMLTERAKSANSRYGKKKQ